MQHTERNQDVFEHIEGYPKPPLMPVPGMKFDELLMDRFGLKYNWFTRLVTKSVFNIFGLRQYYENFPATMEDVLRRNNFRLPGLFAPPVSATVAFRDDAGKTNPIDRAVSLVAGARSLYFDLFSAKLEPDTFKGQPLEMGQYPNLFSTSLIIENKKARVFKSTNIDTITVLFRGHFYLISLGGSDETEWMTGLKAALHHITNVENIEVKENAAGILTAAADPLQLAVFERMQQNPVNKESLETIRHSFLTLCLDLEDEPEDYSDAARRTQSTNYNNRWFHSSFQIVVFGNAKASGIFNFTANLDGNVMMRGGAEVQKRATEIQIPPATAGIPDPGAMIRELKWDINPAAFERAKNSFTPLIDDQQASFEITGIGTKTFKSLNLAAIPVFIVALQDAAEKLAKRSIWIQQFLTMTKYRCMDLEMSDVSTPEVKKFVAFLNSGNTDKAEAGTLIQEAIRSQSDVNRIMRSSLPVVPVIIGYLKSLGGIRKLFVKTALGIVLLKLKLFRQFIPKPRDIVVSHPEIYEEIPIVGRPGIHLPYVRCFGLHYQIYEEKIVITMMPGHKWEVSNKKVVEEIEKSLKRIIELLKD